ncbi:MULTISPECIES: flavin reductase family protein [Glutamicibacter]|uniref:flavin reductase family protein n=1 Tax=Glutamicibacter TaxID=1742989 RepID=UPI00257EC3B4|nr:flavin reductase family protein [Glutamicibacter sp.]
MPSPSLPAEDFKALFRGHLGGVGLITADAGDGPVALTATSVASISVDTPLRVFSVSEQSSAAEVLTKASTLVVHSLDVRGIEVAKLGTTSGIDRFAQAPTWTRLAAGEPVFDGVRAWVRCEVCERVQAGTSTVFVDRALQSHIECDSEPGQPSDGLVYHNRTLHRLCGHLRL